MTNDWKEVRKRNISFYFDGTVYRTTDKNLILVTTAKGRKWLKENQSSEIKSTEKKYSPGGVIDLTPTWENVLKIHLAVLESGSEEGKKLSRIELIRMAQIADKYVDEHKGK